MNWEETSAKGDDVEYKDAFASELNTAKKELSFENNIWWGWGEES